MLVDCQIASCFNCLLLHATYSYYITLSMCSWIHTLTHTCTHVSSSKLTGPSNPLEPSNVMHTGIAHNRATIHWTIPMIAYTPETYTVLYGNTSGSLTPFNIHEYSGDSFTATNLTFSIELTGLSAGMRYYYQVVAMNSLPSSNRSSEQTFTTAELGEIIVQRSCFVDNCMITLYASQSPCRMQSNLH